MKKDSRRVWGKNKFGQTVREHDKIECGSKDSKWFTHVLFDFERNCWHRETDYYDFKVVGQYEK